MVAGPSRPTEEGKGAFSVSLIGEAKVYQRLRLQIQKEQQHRTTGQSCRPRGIYVPAQNHDQYVKKLEDLF